jgi:DedD protein
MSENRRGKDKRFYFSRGQLVLLGAAFTLASAVIFLSGMFVGKSIEGRKLVKPAEPLIRVPVAPSAQGAGATAVGPGKDELTFYDTLTRAPTVEAAITESEKALQSHKPIQQSQPQKRQEPQPKAAEKIAEKFSPAKKSPALESTQSDGAVKPWTVQVNAFPDPRSAQMWVDKLKSKGYNAYSAEVLNKGQTWYRVRVGQFASREEAEKLEQTLRAKENFPKAFVTSR